MSEPREYAVGKTVEHKTNKRRAQIVTLDKGCMQFRPFFEASAFGPAHLSEPNGLERCEDWDIVEPAKSIEDALVDATKLVESHGKVMEDLSVSQAKAAEAKVTPKVPKR